jgi:adenosylcobinamide-GDP ribazoletransferase
MLMSLLLRTAGDLAEALVFLTRLPLPHRRNQRGLGAVVAVFPLAGLILGLLLVAFDTALQAAGLPPTTRNILIVVALVSLTGGLHLDGLMDTCDGLWGGHTPQRRLEIMRDSRVGSYGVLGGACILLLKVAGLEGLHGASRLAALALAPALARWAIVLATRLFPQARPAGLGATFRAAVTTPRLLGAATSSLLIAAIVSPMAGLTAWVACTMLTWLLGRAISGAIGGLTGDSYGAVIELSEVAALFVFALVR